MAESASLSETGVDEVELLRQQFNSWRRQFVLWKTFQSVNSFLFVLLAASATVLVLDQFVALPWMFRVCLVSAASILVAGFALSRVRYLRNPPQFEMLARSIDTDHASQKASLIAAGMLLDQDQFSQHNNRSAKHALQYAYKHLEGWNWQQSINRGTPLRWLVAFVLLLALTSYALINLSLNSVTQRWLTLWNTSAADEVRLAFVDPPKYVYAGQTIEVAVDGSTRANMEAIKLEVQGDYGTVDRLSNNEDQLALFQITAVQSSLRLKAYESSFHTSGVIDIPLRERPRVLRHEFSIIPPDYLRKPAYQSDKAELAIAQGSRVNLRIRLNESVPALLLQSVANSQISGSIEGKPQVNAFDFDLTDIIDIQKSKDKLKKSGPSTTYQISLSARDSQGQQFNLEYPLSLRVQIDTPPAFRFVNPTLDKPSQILAKVGERLRATVTDDHGIDSANLIVQGVSTTLTKQNDELIEQRVLLDKTVNIDAGAPAPSSLEIDQALLRSVFVSKWPACDAIDCSIVAVDSAGQETRSPRIRLLLYSAGSSEAKAIQATSNIIQMQQQLQERTDRVTNSDELARSQLGQLAADQDSIATKWQEAMKELGLQSPEQKKAADSIEQLMSASENQLTQGRLFESSNIQTGILHRLNQFAKQTQAAKEMTDSADLSRSLTRSLENWSKEQTQVAQALKDHVDEPTSLDGSIEALKAVEAKLNREIQQQLAILPEQAAHRWPLSQASKSIAKANAKLQRNIADVSTLMDAQVAADILKSMTDTSVSESESQDSRTAESSEGASEESATGVMQELQIIRSLQSALHERLEAMQGNGSENNPQLDGALRAIGESQSELAKRIFELSQSIENVQQ